MWFHSLHYTACFILSFMVTICMKLPNIRQNKLQQNFSIKYTNRNVVTTTTVTHCVYHIYTSVKLQHSTLSVTSIKVEISQIHGMNLQQKCDFWYLCRVVLYMNRLNEGFRTESSGTWSCVTGWVVNSISDECSVFILEGQAVQKESSQTHALLWETQILNLRPVYRNDS